MKYKIVILDFDCDTSITHPFTKETIESNGGVYILIFNDIDDFGDLMLNNQYKLSDKVYSAFLHFIKFDYQGKGLLEMVDGYYSFGNYTIQIYSKFTRI